MQIKELIHLVNTYWAPNIRQALFSMPAVEQKIKGIKNSCPSGASIQEEKETE